MCYCCAPNLCRSLLGCKMNIFPRLIMACTIYVYVCECVYTNWEIMVLQQTPTHTHSRRSVPICSASCGAAVKCSREDWPAPSTSAQAPFIMRHDSGLRFWTCRHFLAGTGGGGGFDQWEMLCFRLFLKNKSPLPSEFLPKINYRNGIKQWLGRKASRQAGRPHCYLAAVVCVGVCVTGHGIVREWVWAAAAASSSASVSLTRTTDQPRAPS